MSKRTGRKPKRERTTRRRTRRHSSTSESSAEDVPTPPPPPPPKTSTKTRASSRVNECEKKVALTIKLPKPAEGNEGEENTSGMWKVECSNGSDGDIQKLKISLRRSPKDLLREQAAEEKRKEKEAGGSSANSSVLDGSVTNYLEQFGSTIAVEETEQSVVDPNEQVQVVIPATELSFQEDANKIDNDQVDSSGVSSEFKTVHEPVIDNISIDDNKTTDEIVNEPICETNTVLEVIKDPTDIAVESIKPCGSPKEIPDSTVQPPIIECTILEDNSIHISEDKSSDITITNIVYSNVDIPVALSETIQDVVEPKSVENVVNESNTSEIIEEDNVSTVDISKTTKEPNNTDVINDSEQMEDVVQLTVESPDLVDEDDPKPVYEEESKPIQEEESIPVYEETTGQANEKESKLADEIETKPVEESYPTSSSDTIVTKHTDIEKELKLDETPKILSSHPKRKWGSCKTRTPIIINPFTLGTIIDSNGDSIGDNGEYRSEEGEIQRTDSEDEQDADEPMEINDTMLIDHEAVDYEAPEEEEKPDNYNDESKSDKSLTEEINEEEPKKKLSSVKRTNTSCIIRITNLVRPFTVGQLRDLLQRTGKIVANGFWIDTIKSQCIVEYENEDQAIETVYALNESQWPSTNPKFLRVVFTDKEELNKALNGTYPDKLGKPKESLKVEKLRPQLDNHIILREWDRGKLEDINGEKEVDKSIKRKISNDPHVPKEKKAKKDVKELLDKRRKSKSKTPERIPTKSLDELFRKTKTTPTLYWCPLSIEQITEKEDQRRKHLAEMERTQKPDRRRRDNIHYPRRR